MRIPKGWTSVRQLAGVVGIPYPKLVELTKKGKFPLAQGGNGHKAAAVIEQGKLRKALGLPEGEAAAPGYVSLREAAKQKGVTPETLYMAARRKLLKTERFGGVMYTTLGDLAQWEKGRVLAHQIRQAKFQLARLERSRRALAKKVRGLTPTPLEIAAQTVAQVASEHPPVH